MDRTFFSFPYEPYTIQLDLMRQLWRTIEARHVGIVESPTGTGKSMSLICGVLTWYVQNTDEYGLPLVTDAEGVKTTEEKKREEPSWLASYEERAASQTNQELRRRVHEVIAPIEAIRNDPNLQSKKRKMGIAYNHHERKRPRSTGKTIDNRTETDDKHLVAEYDSGVDAHGRTSDSDEDTGTSTNGWKHNDRTPSQFGVVKIIYCSRTHSQISQFIREIQNTVFKDRLRVVSLGSRKNLCVNENVRSLGSDLGMTDKCLDMLKGNTKDKCPYYERSLLGRYKDYALAHVQDIEDLYQLGTDMSICSYYGARESIPLAQVLAMPYSMLLSKDTRESLGIDLTDTIVIFDEAHNIIDAINNTYQVHVLNKQLVVARRSLWNYFKKYDTRLKGKNTFYIKQLLSILESLIKYLRQLAKSKRNDNETSMMMTITDFVFNSGVDNYNMFKIVEYLTHSELSKKLMGFMDGEQNNTMTCSGKNGEDTVDVVESRHVSPLKSIESLFKCLMNVTCDGRILVQPHQPARGNEGSIKFVLLNPANHFREIAEKSRSVILAGGTMQPVAQVIDQLFATIPRERIDLFSCGHVIPPENLMAFTLSTGPSQYPLEFTYSNRNDMSMMDELGRILLNLARIVPNGIVVFFPSYKFEALAVERWTASKQLEQIAAKKSIFREPKDADQLNQVLTTYSSACIDAQEKTGAMLLSVVGGKMSEGINFSDELARCVVMVGLPYPNAQDPELVEKMTFLDNQQPGSGRAFYDSLCMKAVNQSIGRSIRHQRDYASIVLIDQRYTSLHIQRQLPEWIQSRVQPTEVFGQTYSQLVQFYRTKH